MGGELKMAETEGESYDWSPKGDHRLRGKEGVQWPTAMGRISVLMKLKEKTRRWRSWLAKKKNGHGGSPREFAATSSPQDISLREQGEDEDEDPEFHGAPIYESAMASPRAAESPSPRMPFGPTASKPGNDKHEASNNTPPPPPPPPPPATQSSPEADVATMENGRTLTQSVTEMLTRAYNVVSSATGTMTSKLYGLAALSPAPAPAVRYEMMAKQACDKPAEAARMWDNGVSVKTYLMQKLQPGEDERVLSEVITTSMSSRMAGGGHGQGKGVLAKLKEAVSSLLGTEELTGWPALSEESYAEETKRRSFTMNGHEKLQLGHSEATIPVSSNPRQAN